MFFRVNALFSCILRARPVHMAASLDVTLACVYTEGIGFDGQIEHRSSLKESPQKPFFHTFVEELCPISSENDFRDHLLRSTTITCSVLERVQHDV